jgi:hypothetical protein
LRLRSRYCSAFFTTSTSRCALTPWRSPWPNETPRSYQSVAMGRRAAVGSPQSAGWEGPARPVAVQCGRYRRRAMTRADRVQERRRAAALARHYRDEERLTIAKIARRLGRAPATVKAYLYDPTGENARAVKARYVGLCRSCRLLHPAAQRPGRRVRVRQGVLSLLASAGRVRSRREHAGHATGFTGGHAKPFAGSRGGETRKTSKRTGSRVLGRERKSGHRR